MMLMLTHTQLVGWCNPSMLFAEPLWSHGSPAQTPTAISVSPELARVLELEAGFGFFSHQAFLSFDKFI